MCTVATRDAGLGVAAAPRARRPRTAFNAIPVLSGVAAAAGALLTLERVRRHRESKILNAHACKARNALHAEYDTNAQLSQSPCIIFEAGSNSWSGVWRGVKSRLRTLSLARMFSYDRAGYGRSLHRAPCTSVSETCRELLRLLDETRAKPPYVLVAHSLGALYLNDVLRMLPRDAVLGVVYVDAASFETVSLLRGVVPSTVPFNWLAKLLSWFGILRLLAPLLLSAYAFEFRRDKVFWKEARAVWARAEWLRAYCAEWVCAMKAARKRKREGDDWLGGLPITVVVPDVYERTKGKAFVGELQRRLALYSSDSRVLSVRNCGHFVQMERPDVVVDAIRDVILRAKSKKRDGNVPRNGVPCEMEMETGTGSRADE